MVTRGSHNMSMEPKAFMEALQANPRLVGSGHLLQRACMELRVDHVKVLLLDSAVAAAWRRRVDVNAVDDDGMTPVMRVLERLKKNERARKPHAVRHAEYLKARELIRFLHKRGADLNKATGAGIALLWATQVDEYKLPLCRLLMRLGADPCVSYARGDTGGQPEGNLLCDVIAFGRDEGTGGALLKSLIAKCNMDRPSLNEVPLEAAYDHCDVGAFEILLQEGAHIPPQLLVTAQEYAQGGGKEEMQMWHLLKKHLMRRVRVGTARLAPGAQFIGPDFLQTDDGRPEPGRRYFYDARSLNGDGRVPMLFDQDLFLAPKNPYTRQSWSDRTGALRWWKS